MKSGTEEMMSKKLALNTECVGPNREKRESNKREQITFPLQAAPAVLLTDTVLNLCQQDMKWGPSLLPQGH